ncbi:MAG: hypothetical protein GX786_00565, partial [Clostridiales bacterium]|nr:hypothetical protein [Clostridiales bacterium]
MQFHGYSPPEEQKHSSINRNRRSSKGTTPPKNGSNAGFSSAPTYYQVTNQKKNKASRNTQSKKPSTFPDAYYNPNASYVNQNQGPRKTGNTSSSPKKSPPKKKKGVLWGVSIA